MGWGSGSRLAAELIDAAKTTITNEVERTSFYEQMIYAFEEFDCDTLDECVGNDEVFDEVWEELYPSDSYSDLEEEDYE
jgi:hypothetical protein